MSGREGFISYEDNIRKKEEFFILFEKYVINADQDLESSDKDSNGYFSYTGNNYLRRCLIFKISCDRQTRQWQDIHRIKILCFCLIL